MYLKDLAQWRQQAYRLFSATLLSPQRERFRAIAAAAAELYEQRDTTVEFTFFPHWQRFLTSLADPPSYDILNREYVRLFIVNPKRAPCLPYESEYVDPGGQSAGWIVAGLEREYATAGLALSPSLKDLPDHVAVELEFMTFLCRQEADAWNRKAVDEAVQTLQSQAEFLDRHLMRWIPQWTRQVAVADDEGFYSVVTEAAHFFISHDQDLISSLLDKYRKIPEAAQDRAASKAT